MEDHLRSRTYLVAGQLTLADLALYAYTHVADEAGLDLDAYPGVTRWLERVASEPGHVPIDA
jgi:glutathione S-transferase